MEKIHRDEKHRRAERKQRRAGQRQQAIDQRLRHCCWFYAVDKRGAVSASGEGGWERWEAGE